MTSSFSLGLGASLFALGALSCVSQRQATPQEPSLGPRAASQGPSTQDLLGVDEQPSVSQRMAQLQNYLGAKGYEPVDLVLLGRISPGEVLTINRQLPGELRLLAIALSAEDAVPLDMEILDDEKRLLTSDRTPEHRSVVTFVAKSQKRYGIRILAGAAAKRADFALGLFGAPLAAPPASLNEIFERDPVPRLDLGALAGRLAGLGFRAEHEQRGRFENRGGRFVSRQKLDALRCYMFVAAGSRAVGSLSMRVKQGERLLVGDWLDRPDAVCHYCPKRPMTVHVVIDVTAGSGVVSYRIFSAPHRMLSDLFGPATQGELPAQDIDCTFDPPADRLKNDRAEKLAAASFVFARSGLVLFQPNLPWAPIDMDRDTASSEAFTIPAGACRGYALTPASPGMRLSLVSTEGTQIASSSSPLYDNLLLVHCASKQSTVRLQCSPAVPCREGALTGFATNTERAP